MSATQAHETEAQTTRMTLDRETGTLVESATAGIPVGAGVVLEQVVKTMKKNDHKSVNEANPAEKIEKNPVSGTINFSNGTTVDFSGLGTVGLDTEGVRFNKFGSKSALRLLLALTGCTRESVHDKLVAGLASDDIPAVMAALGISEKALDEADALIESLGRESTVVVKGRQQASSVVHNA
jgi:hypothetical protein